MTTIVANTRTLNIDGGTSPVQWRRPGEASFHPGPPLWNGRCKLIMLEPGTDYEILANGVVPQVVTTRPEAVPKQPGGRTLDADPSTLPSLLSGLLPGDTLRLRGGTYRIPATGLAASRSGTSNNYITIENYPGEEAVLTGDLGLTLTWSLYSGSIWQATLPAGVVAENVWDGDSFLWWYSSLVLLQNPTYGPGGFCQVGATLYVRLQDNGDPSTRQMHVSPQDSNASDRYGKLLVVSGNYLEIKGLTFRWVSTPIRLTGQYCVIDNCKAIATHFLVETATGSAGNIVRNCDADGGPSYDVYGRKTYSGSRPNYPWNWPHGRAIWWHNNAVSFEAYGNKFTRFTEGISGMSFGQENNAAVNCNVDLYNNEVSFCKDDAYEVDGAGVNFGMWGNYAHDSYDCLSLAPVRQGPAYIFKNIFAFPQPPARNMGTWIKTGDYSQNALVYVFHNTVYMPSRGGDVSNGISTWAGGPPPQFLFWNNIISVSHKITTGGSMSHREDYNILWTTGDKFWEGTLPYTYFNIAGLRAGTGFEVHGLQVDPGFANPAGGDFTPSQGINLGTPGPLLGQDVSYFEQALGWSGAAPDMGAIEVGGPPPVPVARFSASPLVGYVPLDVTVTDASLGPIDTWRWEFGDGSSLDGQAPPPHRYPTPGVYAITLTVIGPGGSHSASLSVEARQVNAPIAAFTADKDSGTAPLPVAFTNQSTGEATSYLWESGDGQTSAAINATFTYLTPGPYTVRLIAMGPGGTSTAEMVITVLAAPLPPVAGFTPSTYEGTAPLPVAFTNQSTGEIISQAWDFGDGATSSDVSSTHTYTLPGDYTVRLTVTGPGGPDDETATITVLEPATPGVSVGKVLAGAALFATLVEWLRRR